MHGPALPLLLIGVLVTGTVVTSFVMYRASRGQHVWSPGAAFRAPAGDATNVTRHVWGPSAGEDTIRVDVLARRISAEARGGRHRLIEDPGDEGQGDDEVTQQLHTHKLFAA